MTVSSSQIQQLRQKSMESCKRTCPGSQRGWEVELDRNPVIGTSVPRQEQCKRAPRCGCLAGSAAQVSGLLGREAGRQAPEESSIFRNTEDLRHKHKAWAFLGALRTEQPCPGTPAGLRVSVTLSKPLLLCLLPRLNSREIPLPLPPDRPVALSPPSINSSSSFSHIVTSVP